MLKKILFLALISLVSYGQDKKFLPPEMPWSGETEKYIRSANDPWITTAERTTFDSTASMADCYNFYATLAKNYAYCEVQELGTSPGGLALKLVVLSNELNTYRTNGFQKPTLLIQSGIHAGEIDGKDAGMMWARDVLQNDPSTLENINVLLIPILNVEGHERKSPFNRMNQRGPVNMGWRTNGANLNLNRDYAKLETPELQKVIEVIDIYKPSLYLDIHVTDGADYQYDITYGFMGEYSPQIFKVLDQELKPSVNKSMEKLGHIPGPLLFAKNGSTFEGGNLDYNFNPDFSHAYGDAIHLPTILVENHSLKSFKQRVLGTYAFIDGVAEFLGNEYDILDGAILADKSAKKEILPVNWSFTASSSGSATNPWEVTDNGAKSKKKETHKGIKHEVKESKISKGKYIEWKAEPRNFEMAVYKNNIPKTQVDLPNAYVVPAYRSVLIEKVMQHRIPFEILEKDSVMKGLSYKLTTPKFAKSPFEGRFKVSAEVEETVRTVTMPKGSIIIDKSTDKFILASLLLEPKSPSSLFQWGFINTIFNRTEYIEAYALEPYMADLIASNPGVKKSYEEKMKDPKFARSPRTIREWFYNQSPFIDQEYQVYPILRIK